jgi:DNA-binding CsgD family transcriptional regulator
MTSEQYIRELAKYRVEAADTDPAVLAGHIPLLEQLDRIDQSSVALFDMSYLQYRFLTSRFKFLLGLESDKAKTEGMSFFFELMNPDDLAVFFDTSLSAFRFLYSLPGKERKDYKTCQDFRICRADGSWIRMLQQIVVLELDRKANIWLVLIVNDLSPLKDQEIPSRRYMEHTKTGKRVLFAREEAEADSPLSPRELEILGLIARGYPSRDIADYLRISVSTVNNHRQHILEKMQVANTAEAIRYAADLAIL